MFYLRNTRGAALGRIQHTCDKNKEDPKKVLDSLGLERYCCRRMLLGHTEVIDEVMKFRKY